MANRKDVAELAGVSVATVSYVLNRSKNVTPEVERRVREAVETLHYRPNLLARGLAMKESRHVAMLVDNLYNPHYCEILSGAQAAASQNGYIVSVISVDLSSPRDILDLTSRCVDGVILTLSDSALPIIQEYLGPSMPIACMGECVDLDFQPAMDAMIARLAALGHRKIAFLSGFPADSPSHVRLFAWKKAMEASGLTPEPSLIVSGPPGGASSEAEGTREMLELLDRGVDFTAVYAINDLMALGAQRALHTRGLSVPGDVSVVGCDHLQVLGALTPTLATMDLHAFDLGRYLMQQLMETLSGQPHTRRVLPVEFIDGESIARAR